MTGPRHDPTPTRIIDPSAGGVARIRTNPLVRCDALLLDEVSRSNTYRLIEIDGTVRQCPRGNRQQALRRAGVLSAKSRSEESEAKTMIVNGFFEAFTRELPIEYAVELNRVLALHMEWSIG
jgi:Fe-S cluster assembly protein SufB